MERIATCVTPGVEDAAAAICTRACCHTRPKTHQEKHLPAASDSGDKSAGFLIRAVLLSDEDKVPLFNREALATNHRGRWVAHLSL